MKVLLTHRFFIPDSAPYGAMLREIGDVLAKEGHDVHVFSTVPSYRDCGVSAPSRERLGNLCVRRLRVLQREKGHLLRRISNVIWYCTGLIVEVLRLRPDVVTASTFPPVVAAWSSSLAAKLIGGRFIYHVQDIHPEIASYTGGKLGKGLPERILRWLDNQTLQRSDAIITLSQDMVDTLRARGLNNLSIHVMNNPALNEETEGSDPPTALRKKKGKRRVIFAGNLGRFQNLPLLVEGVATCFANHPDLELMLLGDGVALPELRRTWGHNPQVLFGPFLPFRQARQLIVEADIGLVSLSPDIYRVAYPSKVSTYLDLGLKVLALVEPGSQLARDLESTQRGVVPEAPTPESIGDAMERLLQIPEANASGQPSEIADQNTLWVDLFRRSID